MSLASAPTFTPGSTGNVYASTALAGNASVTTSAFSVGLAGGSGPPGSTTTGSAVAGRLQVLNIGGTTVAATNGCQVQIFSSSDNGVTYDTVPYLGPFIIATTQGATSVGSYDLPPGQYKLKFTNLDTSNGITVEATLGTTA
jgi:hypothetical protein